MRRIGRWMFNALTALSLLLCVGTVVLWVRSYRAADHFWLNYRSGGGDLLRTDQGEFTIYRSKFTRQNPTPGPRVTFRYERGPLVGSHSSPGSYPIQWRWGPFSYAAVPPPRAVPNGTESLEGLRSQLAALNALPAPPRGDGTQFARREELEMQLEMKYEELQVLQGRLSHWEFVLPAWLVVALTLAWPVWVLAKLIRSRRRARLALAGFCPNCHYDLTGNVSGVCPECGAMIMSEANSGA